MNYDYVSRIMELVEEELKHKVPRDVILYHVINDKVISEMIRNKEVTRDRITMETQKYISLLSRNGRVPTYVPKPIAEVYGPAPPYETKPIRVEDRTKTYVPKPIAEVYGPSPPYETKPIRVEDRTKTYVPKPIAEVYGPSPFDPELEEMMNDVTLEKPDTNEDQFNI